MADWDKIIRQAKRRLSGSGNDTTANLEKEIAGYDEAVAEQLSQLAAAIEEAERSGETDRANLLASVFDKIRSARIDDLTEEEMNLEY